MNFAPHHAFGGCAALEREVESLRTGGRIPDAVLADHERYHFSLLHKLRSARYHVETLGSYLQSQEALTVSPQDLVYRVNFHFDGFLHVVGSASDIFARELLTYFGIPLPARVYFQTAADQIRTHRPGDPILPLLDAPTWRQEFTDYRNTATHESFIGRGYTIAVEVRGGATIRRVVFPIPDDPRAHPPTYRRNPDIAVYCQTTFRRVLSLFNQAYNHLAPRIRGVRQLPI